MVRAERGAPISYRGRVQTLERPLTRAQRWERATGEAFDVAIIGAGVSGAAVYRELARQGYRVLLVDRGDHASGTSQASGMLVWGGLLYLKQLDIRTVIGLSRAREALLKDQPDDIHVAPFRFISRRHSGPPAWLMRAGLEAYWYLGRCARKRPKQQRDHPASGLCRRDVHGPSVRYEEAALRSSDSRLVLDWILGARDDDRIALNHCEVLAARRDGAWSLDLVDRVTGAHGTAQARIVVNAAGVWADGVSDLLGVQTRHRHVFSKGVYLGLPRPRELTEFLAFAMTAEADTQTFTPWGPIALWGPTETSIESLDGAFDPTVEDVRFLLGEANANLARRYGPEDVISLRTGVRPLCVERSYSRKVYPLELSRRHLVEVDGDRSAITLFGGKITSAPTMAREAAAVLRRDFEPTVQPVAAGHRADQTTNFRFPGLEAPLIDPARSATDEDCISVLDYVRRRTNVAQWSRGMGLDGHTEGPAALARIAELIHGASGAPPGLEELVAAAEKQRDLLRRV